MTSENVRAFRRRHSIDADWRSDAGASPAVRGAEVPQPAAAETASPQAYSVSVTGFESDSVIVAANLVEAAMRATEAVRAMAPTAQVTAIRHLGPAIV